MTTRTRCRLVRLTVTLSSSLGKLPAQANNFNRNKSDRRLSGTMERNKVGKKTCPWTTATAVNCTLPLPPQNDQRMSVRRKFSVLLKYFNPFAAIPLPPDEEPPAVKRPRLQTSTSIPTVAEDVAWLMINFLLCPTIR
jgi:hypothetical protein